MAERKGSNRSVSTSMAVEFSGPLLVPDRTATCPPVI